MFSLLQNSRKHDVTFRSDGRIDISARIAVLLGLEDNDVIDVLTERGEFYLYVRLKANKAVGRYEAVCHPSNRSVTGRRRNLRTYSRRLCETILKASRCSDVARLPAGDSIEFEHYGTVVPLITHNPL